jgi:hypothetical protein
MRTQMTVRALRGQPLPQSSVPSARTVTTGTAAVPSCDWECARLRMDERAECSRVRRGEWIENVCGHSLGMVLAGRRRRDGTEAASTAPRCLFSRGGGSVPVRLRRRGHGRARSPAPYSTRTCTSRLLGLELDGELDGSSSFDLIVDIIVRNLQTKV